MQMDDLFPQEPTVPEQPTPEREESKEDLQQSIEELRRLIDEMQENRLSLRRMREDGDADEDVAPGFEVSFEKPYEERISALAEETVLPELPEDLPDEIQSIFRESFPEIAGMQDNGQTAEPDTAPEEIREKTDDELFAGLMEEIPDVVFPGKRQEELLTEETEEDENEIPAEDFPDEQEPDEEEEFPDEEDIRNFTVIFPEETTTEKEEPSEPERPEKPDEQKKTPVWSIPEEKPIERTSFGIIEPVHEKKTFTLPEDMAHGARTIGKMVIEAAKKVNCLKNTSTPDRSELVNLVLGRTEVAKAEIMNICLSELPLERKKSAMDEQLAAVNEYFRSVLAQFR